MKSLIMFSALILVINTQRGERTAAFGIWMGVGGTTHEVFFERALYHGKPKSKLNICGILGRLKSYSSESEDRATWRSIASRTFRRQRADFIGRHCAFYLNTHKHTYICSHQHMCVDIHLKMTRGTKSAS